MRAGEKSDGWWLAGRDDEYLIDAIVSSLTASTSSADGGPKEERYDVIHVGLSSVGLHAAMSSAHNI